MPGLTTSVRRGPREPRHASTSAAPVPARLHIQLAGCILWLPPKTELVSSGYDSDSLEEDRCDHPVVVLSPFTDDGKVVYLMITSLKGVDLDKRFSHPTVRLEHIPIRPCKPHPDNGMLLSLEDVTLAMRKNSYVKTRTQHRGRLNILRAYDRRGPEYVLSRKSYQELIEYVKFTAPAPHPGSNAVTSPPRRGRSGSYSEYVSVLRGLESGLGSPPPAQSHLPHIPSPNLNPTTRYQPRTSARRSDRDPLIGSSYPRSYDRQTGTYTNYQAGGHPGHAYRNARRNGYGHGASTGPTEPFDWAMFWKVFKVLFWIGTAMVGFYGVARGVQWMGGAAKDAAGAIKQGIDGLGTKLVEFWSGFRSNFGGESIPAPSPQTVQKVGSGFWQRFEMPMN